MKVQNTLTPWETTTSASSLNIAINGRNVSRFIVIDSITCSISCDYLFHSIVKTFASLDH